MKSMIVRLATILAVSLFAMSASNAQQFTMRISSPTINDVVQEWAKVFKEGVETRSKGRIKVEFYPANQLGQIPATVEGVALGTIQMTIPATGFFIGIEPRFQVFDIPGLFDSVEHAEKVLNDPQIRKRLSSFGESKGVEPLFTAVNGPLMILAYKPIRQVADFQGQKIRVAGAAPLQVKPFEKLGASPLSMPLGEVLPAMQNHTIDGLTAAFTVFTAFKYYDIAKGLTYLPKSYLVASGLVNRAFMKSLGPELEGIVRDEAHKAEKVFSTRGVEDLARIQADWKKNGGELITLSPAESKRYLDDVTSLLPPMMASNPQLKEDYEALLAAAGKYRK